jgi:DNA polymerase-3 subunit epsilon
MDLTQYVVLDTETNGLPPGQQPWEIALFTANERGEWTQECIHISDYDPSLVTPEAGEINGFHWRWMAAVPSIQRMTRRDAVTYLERVLAGKRIVGSNPSFDTDALVNMGCNPVWNYASRDVPSMFLGAYGYEVKGLGGVLAALDIENQAPHTAIGDARATRDAFIHILQEAR